MSKSITTQGDKCDKCPLYSACSQFKFIVYKVNLNLLRELENNRVITRNTRNGRTVLKIHNNDSINCSVFLTHLKWNDKGLPLCVNVKLKASCKNKEDLHSHRLCIDATIGLYEDGFVIDKAGHRLFGDLLISIMQPEERLAPTEELAYTAYRIRLADDVQNALGISLPWSMVQAEICGDKLTLELLYASFVDRKPMTMAVYEEMAFGVYFIMPSKRTITVPDFVNHRQMQFIVANGTVVLGTYTLDMQLLTHIGYVYGFKTKKHIVPITIGATLILPKEVNADAIAAEHIEDFLRPIDKPAILYDYIDKYNINMSINDEKDFE